MSDEIKQPGNVAVVTPLTRTRDAGKRRNPHKPLPKPGAGKRRQPPKDDQSHHVDEYV